MRLAEIVRGPDTSDATVATVERLAAAAGKHPIVVKDQATAWGYVANRVYGGRMGNTIAKASVTARRSEFATPIASSGVRRFILT